MPERIINRTVSFCDTKSVLNNKNFLFISALFLLSGLLFANFYLSNDLISLVVTGIVCVWIVSSKQKEVVIISLFFAPFSYLFRYSQWNLYIFVQLSLILKCIMLKKTKTGVYLFAFTYFLFYMLSSIGTSLKFGSFIPFVSLVSLLFVASIYKKEERIRCLVYFISGFLISSIYGLFISSTRLVEILDSNPIMLGTGSVVQRFGGILPDCNFYTILSALCICFVAFSYGMKRFNLVRLLAFFGLIVFGAFTFSKSFYICLAVVLFFRFITFDKKQFKFLAIVILVGAVSFYVFRDRIGLILDTAIGRFLNSTDSLDSFTNGRYNYWLLYLDEWSKTAQSIFLGYGADTLLNDHIVAHNTFLEVLYKFGLFGLIMNVALVVYAKKIMGTKTRIRVQNILPLLLLIVATFNLSAYSFYPLWSCIFVSLIVLDYNPKKGSGVLK